MTQTGSKARNAATSAAAAALDAEIEQVAGGDRFALLLRACARGGHAMLDGFCDAVEDPVHAFDEAPASSLVAALSDAGAAERAVRAAAWVMTAQRLSAAWPRTFHERMVLARAAMPLTDGSYDHMLMLAALTACANTTEDPDTRDGQRMQFSRESLEYVIGAATGARPARRDMLLVISPWTTAFIRGINVCQGHLPELDRLHPDAVAS